MLKVSSNKVLVVVAILLNTIVFTGVFTRATDVDEGMISAHSFYLNELGYVKSPHFHNANFGWEERQYHYHKLFVWIGAGVSKVFGFHLMSFRLISYFFYLLFLFALFKFIQLKNLPIKYFWFFQIVFLINSTAFKFGFIFRPEIAVMCLGFISYYFLEKSKQANAIYHIVFAGISAGLAMLIHLNGVIFIIAGTFLLFITRKYLKGFVFGASGTVVSLFYFIDTLSIKEFHKWKEHFFADPNLTLKKASPLLKVLDEHMRFFHSEREIIFSVLFLLSLIFAYKYFKNQFKGTLLYLLLLVVSLSFVAHGTTTKYMLTYMPFLVLVVCVALHQFRSFSLPAKLLFSTSLLIFIGYHIYVNTLIMSKSYNVIERNRVLADKIPEKNTLIFANECFVFDEISDFTIQSHCAYNFKMSKFHPLEELSLKGLFDFLYEGKTKYVLIDRLIEISHIYHQIPYDELEVGSTYFNYQVIDKGEDFILFKINEEKPQSYQADFSAETLVKTL